MEQSNKIKISKEHFDELYEIEEITGEKSQDTANPEKDDTTPEFLTEEEEDFDNKLHEYLPQEDTE